MPEREPTPKAEEMTKKTTRKTTAKKTATKARAPRKGEDGTGMERQEGNGRNGR